jgi:hypothetical protein
VFVGCNSHVQRQLGIHEILHSFSISAHLSRQTFPPRLLCHDGNRGYLLVMGLRERLCELCPVAKFWNKDLPGNCLSFEALWFFNASMNIITDIALLVLPMPLLSKLQLPRTQKIALMGVFAMGILVVVTSVLRLSSLREVAKSPDTSCASLSCLPSHGSKS